MFLLDLVVQWTGSVPVTSVSPLSTNYAFSEVKCYDEKKPDPDLTKKKPDLNPAHKETGSIHETFHTLPKVVQIV